MSDSCDYEWHWCERHNGCAEEKDCYACMQNAANARNNHILQCIFEGAHQAGCRDGEPQCLPCARRRLAAMTAERDVLNAEAECQVDGIPPCDPKRPCHMCFVSMERREAQGRLAESQARERQKGNALTRFVSAHALTGPREDSWTKGIVDIYEFQRAEVALALPRDSTALDALLLRCAEAVREACAKDCECASDCNQGEHCALNQCRDSIRKLDLAAILAGLRP